ncbi:MAG: hypothetical protein AAGI66_07325 [Cyanobacteria bacterium P01_H01_bin.74]
MGNEQLQARSSGQEIQAQDVNQYRNALIGDILPRNASASVEAGVGNLGNSTNPWQNLYISGNVIQNGTVLDFSDFSSISNKINSGEVLPNSGGKPGYLSFLSTSTTGQIIAATTNLSLVINNTSVTVTTNINIFGLATAPGSNNTCTINNQNLNGQNSTQYLGEDGQAIPINNIGAEILALDNTVQSFKKGNEYFIAFIDVSNNQIMPLLRGVGQTTRETLAHTDVLTLMQLNHIFLDDDGTTPFKTSIFPTFESTDPPIGSANQWYFNTKTKRWLKYSTSWITEDAAYLGYIICDATQAVASESADFTLDWASTCTGRLTKLNNSKIHVQLGIVSVAGEKFQVNDAGTLIDLSNGDDLEAGQIELPNTTYYLYLDNALKTRFSRIVPRLPDLKAGLYHPQKYWRCIGKVLNDISSDLGQPVFLGEDTDFKDKAVINPGQSGIAVPFYKSPSEITLAHFDVIDSTGQIQIARNSESVIDTGTSFFDGVSEAGTLGGTVSISENETTVSGVGTSFTSDFLVGDLIKIDNNEARQITVITSDVLMTVESPWTSNATNVLYTSGGLAPNTFYYLYAISDGVTPGLLLSSRSVVAGDSAPLLPSGYSFYKELPLAVLTNDLLEIVPFSVAGGWPNQTRIRYVSLFQAGVSGATNVLSAGTANDYTNISASNFIPKTSQYALLYYSATGSGVYTRVRANGDSNEGYDMNAYPLRGGYIVETPLDENQAFEYRRVSGSGDIYLDIFGYVTTLI